MTIIHVSALRLEQIRIGGHRLLIQKGEKRHYTLGPALLVDGEGMAIEVHINSLISRQRWTLTAAGDSKFLDLEMALIDLEARIGKVPALQYLTVIEFEVIACKRVGVNDKISA